MKSNYDLKPSIPISNNGNKALQGYFAIAKDLRAALHQNHRPVGGQISKSGELFIPAFLRQLQQNGFSVKVCLSQDTLKSTLLGIYRFLQI